MEPDSPLATLNTRSTINEAFKRLQSVLREAHLRTTHTHWSFPGNGPTRKALETWDRAGDEALAIAIGPRRLWRGRTPLLVALEPAFDRICSVVELNIPEAGALPNRRINGVFGAGAEGELWLLHRGSKLTAHGGVIPKERIFQHFAARRHTVDDRDREVEVILAARIDAPDFVDQLRAFTLEVRELKGQFSRDPSSASLEQLEP